MKVDGYILICDRCKIETFVTWGEKSGKTCYNDPPGWKEIKRGLSLCPDCHDLYKIIEKKQEAEMKNFYANE